MHTAPGYETAVQSMTRKNIWEIEIVPDYKTVTELANKPNYSQNLDENAPDIFRSQISAPTFFEPNTNRNGTMRLVADYPNDNALRSSEFSTDAGTFSNPLSVEFFTEVGTNINESYCFPYYEIGFSTRCDNGDHATGFTVELYRWHETEPRLEVKEITVSNYTDDLYRIPKIDGWESTDKYPAHQIKITITEWSAPKARAVISRIYFGEHPYTITNNELTETPNVFKELESDGDVGSVSANQIRFGFYNAFGFDDSAVEAGALIKTKFGIRTDDYQTLFDYGTFFLESGSLDKNIFTVTGNDRMYQIINSDFKYFDLDVSKNKEWQSYLGGIMGDVLYDHGSGASFFAPGENSGDEPAPYRRAKYSDLLNELGIFSGSYFSFDDSDQFHVYHDLPNVKGAHVEVSKENLISFLSKKRKIPMSVTINKYELQKLPAKDGGYVLFSQTADDAPSYELIGPAYDAVIYENENGMLAVDPTSMADGTDPDYSIIKADGGVLSQQYWHEPDVGPFVPEIKATEVYQFADKPKEYFVNFHGMGSNFVFNTYIAPTKNGAYKSTAQKIYDSFKARQNEFVVEVLTDPSIEPGDPIIIHKDETTTVKGMIIRIEVSGSKTKLTVRGEYDNG